MQQASLATQLGRGACGPSLPAPASQCGKARPRGTALRVSAAGTNGSVPGVDSSKQGAAPSQAVELLEMVVADDLRPQAGQQRRPSKRLVPAPHKAAPILPPKPVPNGVPALAAAASVAVPSTTEGLNGSRKATVLNGGNGVVPQLPPAVQQLVARQNGSSVAGGPPGANKALTNELMLAQRTVQEQQLELKQTKKDLMAKEAEVVTLKQELAEKDGKLKAARTDALESRMALQQKDAELKVAYAQLSQAVQERSAMRTQLAQTHAELAETRAELEQLADDILAIKMLMEEDGDGSGGGFSVFGFDFGSGELDSSSLGAGAGSSTGANGSSSSEDAGMDVLLSLAALSRQLAEDAKQDDEAITQALAETLDESTGSMV